MSFGAFSLFNFFQQPNTGHQPTSPNTGIVASGNKASGVIADFNWYFPYATTNIQYNSITTNKFQHEILGDSYGAFIPGLHYATISTVFSGSFQSNRDFASINSSFYGMCYPQLSGLFKEYSQFSGMVSGTPKESMYGVSQLSGIFTGQVLEIFNCGVNFSGEISSNNDITQINTQFSGIITGENIDNLAVYTSFSGTAWPMINDNKTIGFSFVGYSVSSGITIINVVSGDNDTIGFSLVGVQISN